MRCIYPLDSLLCWVDKHFLRSYHSYDSTTGEKKLPNTWVHPATLKYYRMLSTVLLLKALTGVELGEESSGSGLRPCFTPNWDPQNQGLSSFSEKVKDWTLQSDSIITLKTMTSKTPTLLAFCISIIKAFASLNFVQLLDLRLKRHSLLICIIWWILFVSLWATCTASISLRVFIWI